MYIAWVSSEPTIPMEVCESTGPNGRSGCFDSRHDRPRQWRYGGRQNKNDRFTYLLYLQLSAEVLRNRGKCNS